MGFYITLKICYFFSLCVKSSDIFKAEILDNNKKLDSNYIWHEIYIWYKTNSKYTEFDSCFTSKYSIVMVNDSRVWDYDIPVHSLTLFNP